MTETTGTTRNSAWAPFRSRVFAVLWTALLIGNIGTWMRDVASGWLMTSLSASAITVALVQVATTLPIFLMSLPAGALADSVDRRRLMLALSSIGAAILAGLAAVTHWGTLTPQILLACLLAAGVVTALMTPVVQSLIPAMVDAATLREAVALNSMGLNIARAIGPAIGGFIVVSAGAAWAFWVDAATYLALVAAFLWWRGAAAPASIGKPERFAPAMLTGVRYAWHAPDFQRVLARAALFFIFASAFWALLPILARRHLGGDATFYGLLLASIGAGAVLGALVLPTLRSRLSAHALMQTGLTLTVAALLTLAFTRNRVAAAAALAFAGAAWITVLTTANSAAQVLLPNWVRGRGLAIYLTIFYGVMTLGSLLWGAVAESAGVTNALTVAAIAGLVSALVSQQLRLPDRQTDLTPSNHWPEVAPAIDSDSLGARGPVMVTVQYRIARENRAAFVEAMNALSAERRRDGAHDWGVFESVEDPEKWTEVFFLSDWDEHERQHRRVTRADADVQATVRAMTIGGSLPVVTHAVAP